MADDNETTVYSREELEAHRSQVHFNRWQVVLATEEGRYILAEIMRITQWEDDIPVGDVNITHTRIGRREVGTELRNILEHMSPGAYGRIMQEANEFDELYRAAMEKLVEVEESEDNNE